MLDPWSAHQVRSLPGTAGLNLDAAREMGSEWWDVARTSRGEESPPAEGEGRVSHSGTRVVGQCTVGVVTWNDAGLSGDCGLHGSRFAPDGEVLEGPATRGLRRL